MTDTKRLAGMSVFVVEDEFLIMMQLEQMLSGLGCTVGKTAAHLDDALKVAASTEFDAALLDVNLAGKKIYPVAEVLRQRGVPIVFSTGYGQQGLEAGWQAYPVVQKPFIASDLEKALTKAREMKPAS
jgi:CheY-like chemotaxis protein